MKLDLLQAAPSPAAPAHATVSENAQSLVEGDYKCIQISK